MPKHRAAVHRQQPLLDPFLGGLVVQRRVAELGELALRCLQRELADLLGVEALGEEALQRVAGRGRDVLLEDAAALVLDDCLDTGGERVGLV
jgi:hypothetical protein